jgi:hypothetical protein
MQKIKTTNRGVIKGVLAEELENSLFMEKKYRAALEKLPPGALVAKNINGYEYYYLAQRVGNKVRTTYLGKLSPEEIAPYLKTKKLRALYRTHLSQSRQQIKYLKGALRGKKQI